VGLPALLNHSASQPAGSITANHTVSKLLLINMHLTGAVD
jgi:hypothetical protein